MSWDKKKDGGQDDDKNIVYNDDMEHDKLDDLNEDLLHLRNRLGDNINDVNNKHQYNEEEGILNEDEGQGNYFGTAKNIPLANNFPLGQNEHFGGAVNIENDKDENNDIDNENQNHGVNNGNQISDDDTTDNASYDDDMIAMMAFPKVTINMIMTHQKTGIITQNMRNMKIIMLMNLEMIVKMQMRSNKLKKMMIQEEEEADRVCAILYLTLITKMHLTEITGIDWLLTYALW